MIEQLDAAAVTPEQGGHEAPPAASQPASPPQPPAAPAPAATQAAAPAEQPPAKPTPTPAQPAAPDQPAGEAAPAPAAAKKVTGKRVTLAIILLAVLAVGAYFIWKVFFAVPPVPASIVILSGRIEGDDSAAAVKPTGRILEVRVREGDRVKAGDIIAVLDDQQIRDREEKAQAVLAGEEAKAVAARDQIAFLEEQLRQNQLQTEQSDVDAQGRVRQAEADMAAAEADAAQQQAAYELAAFDGDACTALAKTGAVSERQGKQSVSTAGQQAAAVAAARRRVEASNGALTTARANLANPGIRGEQVLMVRRQIAQQQAEIASALANAKQARFQLSEAHANRSDLIVRAPFDGTVITRSAEPGEVVPAGAAVVSLLDLSKVYLRGFVPEGSIGKVKAGQQALVKRADLKAAEAQAARLLRSAARAERLPSASISARLWRHRSDADAVEWDVHAGGSSPGSHLAGRTDGRRHRAGRCRVDRAKRGGAGSSRARIESDIREAFLDMAAAGGQVEVGVTNLRVTKETLDLTRQRFDAGVTDNVEVVQAQESVAGAELDYINSVFAHNLAKLSLARAIGGAAENLAQFLKLQ